MERFIVWVWRVLNIVLCMLLGGATGYNYLTLASYDCAHPSDLVTLAALLAVPVMGGSYHLYRLFRPYDPGAEPRSQIRTALTIPAELCVLFAAGPIFFIAGMGFGERIYAYRHHAGYPYLRPILGAENAYHEAKGVYTDSFADLTNATPPFLDKSWLGPKCGYDFKLTILDGGEHFAATAVAGPNRKWSRTGYYVDDTGVIRRAPEGTTPGKNSQPMFQD